MDAPVDAPPPPRQLGLEVDQPDGFDQGEQIARVTPFGVGVVTLTFPWNVLEPNGNGFDQNALGLLEFGMGFYRGLGVKVVLSLPVVDTIKTLVPSDLAGKALDSPQVIARAKALIDKVVPLCGTELEYLVLSNEVDINLAQPNAPTWAQLTTLTAAEATEVHATRAEVKTGVSVTANALVSANADAIAALHANDVAFVTYYHAGNFGNGSTDVAADLTMIVGATDRPVVFKEFGYATGAQVGGSAQGQSDFITAAFAAWDSHADRIPLLVYSRMFDGDLAKCTQQAADYNDPGDQAFIQFLCTLGLRGYDDTAKPAWSTFTTLA
ncbi:MAG TPA: hypothetical protein VGC41_15585, partial [Kofleriaceae bacterium]